MRVNVAAELRIQELMMRWRGNVLGTGGRLVKPFFRRRHPEVEVAVAGGPAQAVDGGEVGASDGDA